jgi:hypothetical protein
MMKENFCLLIALSALLLLLAVPSNAQAALYFSMPPDSETCITQSFGYNGIGEYTLTVDDPGYAEGKPWVDNHYTQFHARLDNIVVVPLCFSTYGREDMEQALIKVTVSTPTGTETYDYGVCVSDYSDVDSFSSVQEEICKAMAESTDIFSAGFVQPEKYANPGETVNFTLLLDSDLPLSLSLAKSSGSVSIVADRTSVQLGSGQEEVNIRVVAPSAPGDYEFGVMVSVEGCSIADCRREVGATVHVAGMPNSSFDMWLAPDNKNIVGVQSTQYSLTVQNYGPRQTFSLAIGIPNGVESDFIPHSVPIETGIPYTNYFNVRPKASQKNSYKVTATVTAADGSKKSLNAWLTVDEMVGDAQRDAAVNPNDQNAADEFTNDYNSGGVTLDEWNDYKSVTGGTTGGNETGGGEAPQGPNMILWIVIAVVVVVVVVLVFIIYSRTRVEGGPSWESLGI